MSDLLPINFPTSDRKPLSTRNHPSPGGTAGMPVIALVGRPNVGKSTLFNRLTRSRQALVAAVPGTTRDRREGVVDDGQYRFRLVDTGGMSFGMGLEFSREVEAQVGEAVVAADYLWLVLDAREGLNPFDADLHRWVVRQGRPYRVVVNKADDLRQRSNVAQFYALGTDRIHAISAEHALGVSDLLEATAADLPGMKRGVAEGVEDAGPGALRVAFLGRPNVGKSSLLNRVLGRARMIVSETAGTTREAVEVPFELYGRDYVLVDTAGIRRRARTEEHLEKLGVLHTLGSLDWVRVAILVVDASEEIATQDARIGSYILDHRRAVVVAMNKWDRVKGGARHAKEVEEDIRERLRFLQFAAFVRTSAIEGAGIEALFREVQRAAAQFQREIRTADLNRVVQAASLRFPPPAQAGSPTRIHYGTQVGREPPAFRFFTNHPKRIDEAYTRFFENQLRHHFGLEGTPLRIEWRGRSGERTGDPVDDGAGARRPAKRKVGAPAKSGVKQGAKPGGKGAARDGGSKSGTRAPKESTHGPGVRRPRRAR